MAPSLEVAGVPVAVEPAAAEEKVAWDEKKAVLVDVEPETKSQDAESSSAIPERPIPSTKFELEDHPIDVVRNLRVCILAL
jgi:hypothetical protein